MTTSSEWQKWRDHLSGYYGRVDASVEELNAAWSAVPGKTFVSEELVSGTSWKYMYYIYEFRIIYTRTLPQTVAVKLDRNFRNFAEFLLVREYGSSYRRIKHIVGWPQNFSVAFYMLSMAGARMTASEGALWLSDFPVEPIMLTDPDGALGDDYKKRLVDSLNIKDSEGRLRLHDLKNNEGAGGSLEVIMNFLDSTNVTFLFELDGVRGERPKSTRAVYPAVFGDVEPMKFYTDTMLDMIAPSPALRVNYGGPSIIIREPSVIHVYNGFLPPLSADAVREPASTMAPASGKAVSPLLSHIGRNSTPITLSLLGVDTPGSWRLDNGLGHLEPQGKTAVYTPPEDQTPVVQYSSECITRIPAAIKATLRKPVDVDVVKHVQGLNALLSHFLIYNSAETHFFRVSQAGDFLKLTLWFDGWEGEEAVEPGDIEWTELLGNGVMTQDGLFKPAASSPSPYTTIQAVHKDPRFLYWAVITLPVPQMTVEEAVKMLNS